MTRTLELLSEVARQARIIACAAGDPGLRARHLAIEETCRRRIAELEEGRIQTSHCLHNVSRTER